MLQLAFSSNSIFFPLLENGIQRCSLSLIKAELSCGLDKADPAPAPANGGGCGSEGREDRPITEGLAVQIPLYLSLL